MTENNEQNKQQPTNPQTEVKKKWKFIQARKPLTELEETWKKKAYILFGSFMFLFVAQILAYTIFTSFYDWVCVLILAMILIMPGYLANAGMLITGGGTPIDFGHVCKDGRRLFGPGKTWRGLFGGPLLIGLPFSLLVHGILIACWPALEAYITLLFTEAEGTNTYVLFALDPDAAVNLFKVYFTGASTTETILQGFPKLIFRILAVAFATPLGDLTGSFFKRRKGISRGEPFWLVDQADFAVTCLIFGAPFVFSLMGFWLIVIFVMILAPSITIFANTITYLMGHKSVPW